MKFSIVIPIYNVEKYIRECLDSIVIQLKEDIEIILLFAGSGAGWLERSCKLFLLYTRGWYS